MERFPARLRVVSPDGGPISRVLVTIESTSIPIPELALRPNCDGEIEVMLPRGTFTIRAFRPDGPLGEVACEVTGTGADTFEIMLP